MKKSTATSSNSLLLPHWAQPVTLIFSLCSVLLAVTPFVFLFITDELFEFNKMVFVYLLTTLIVGVWASRMVIEQRFIWRRTILDIPLLLFLLSQIISTLLSIHPYTSFFGYYSRFHGGLLSSITYIFLYYAVVSNLEKKHIIPLLLSMTIGMIGVSAYAIPEHFGHSVSCLLISGGTSFDAECWKQDVQARVFASFGQPNWLAGYLIMGIPVTLALASLRSSTRGIKWLMAVATIAGFVALLFTKSRSGILGLGLGMSVYTALLLWITTKHSVWKQALSTQWLMGVALSLVLALTVFGSPYTPPLTSLVENTTLSSPPTNTSQEVINRLDQGGTESGEIRKIVWSGAIKVWQRYPIFGSGLETFAYSYYLDRPIEHNLVSEWDFLYNKAHNEFLQYLANAGIMGLITYLAVLGWFGVQSLRYIAQAMRILHQHPHRITSVHLVIAIASAVVALSVSNFFGFSTVMVTVLLYVYFAIVAIYVREHHQPIATPAYTKKATLPLSSSVLALKNSQLIILFLLWCVVVSILIWIGRYWYADVAFASGKKLFDTNPKQGIDKLFTAVQIMPSEALYYDQLATQYSEMAVSLASMGLATQSAQFVEASVLASETALYLNPHHINFYKTRAGVFIRLSQLDPEFLDISLASLEEAHRRAPTDAKIVYNIGLIQFQQQQYELATATLLQAIALKPNYGSAMWQLGQLYEATEQTELAIQQYQALLAIDPLNTLPAERLEILLADEI